MSFVLYPWQLMALAGYLNREQQLQVDYLRTEVAILREKLGYKKRLLLNDDQRRRLAAKDKAQNSFLLLHAARLKRRSQASPNHLCVPAASRLCVTSFRQNSEVAPIEQFRIWRRVAMTGEAQSESADSRTMVPQHLSPIVEGCYPANVIIDSVINIQKTSLVNCRRQMLV